jgi:hypothetical protein
MTTSGSAKGPASEVEEVLHLTDLLVPQFEVLLEHRLGHTFEGGEGVVERLIAITVEIDDRFASGSRRRQGRARRRSCRDPVSYICVPALLDAIVPPISAFTAP